MSSKQNNMRKARKDRLAATPAKPSERIVGSEKNTKGSASSSKGGIDLSQDIVRALQTKMRMHNKRMSDLDKPSHSLASLGMLKAVFRRGAGAYSVSHRPGMTRNQWAYGRVNAFLKMLDKGKPTNLRYVGDSDLLPSGHPWKSKGGKSDDATETKALGRKLRRISRATEPYDPNAIDGDSDGTVQEGTAFERPAAPRIQRSRQVVSGFIKRPKGKDTPADEVKGNIAFILEKRNNTRTSPQPPNEVNIMEKIMADAVNATFIRTVVTDAMAQGFTFSKSKRGEYKVHSPYAENWALMTVSSKDPRNPNSIKNNLKQIGFIWRENLATWTKADRKRYFGTGDIDEIVSANPDEFKRLLRSAQGGDGADDIDESVDNALSKDSLYELISNLYAFRDDPKDSMFRDMDVLAAVLGITDEGQIKQLEDAIRNHPDFKNFLMRKGDDKGKISGSMSRRRIAGSMSITPPPSSDPDPWDEALEGLIEEEYEDAFNSLMDEIEQAQKDDEAFFNDAITSYDIWKDSPFANPNWVESEWIDDQPGRYAPKPPELKDPDSIDWDKMLAAIDSDFDDDDQPWDAIADDIQQSQDNRKKLRQEWTGSSKAAKQKRADLWKQFTSEDVWLQELADEYSTPRSILHSALMKAGQESGMQKDDVDRALRAAERAWSRRSVAYEKNKALAEIDAEIDAMGATVPRSINAIDQKLNRLNRKLDRVKEARNQASSEYQASRRAYTRAMVLGSWLYDTKPVRKDGESSEDFAFRMYQWAVDTNPIFMRLIQQLDEYAEVGTGTRGLFSKLDTQAERLRDERTKLTEMRARALERNDGAVRALSPTEFRKAVQERKRQEQALLENPMYRRFISGAMSSRNYTKKPLASVAKTRTSSITPREMEALSYIDAIGGGKAVGRIVLPSGRKISGSIQAKPSYKLHTLLDIPKRLPSSFDDRDYDRDMDTMQKYGTGRRKVTDERYSGVWQRIIRGITDFVTKSRQPNEPKRAIIIGGAPGTGKSTQRLNGFGGRIPSRSEAAHVDIDEMKQLIPEYNGYISRGNTHAAGATHTESQNLSFSTISEAIRQELDIVFDSSGQFNNDPGTLSKLRNAGYNIEAHYFVGDRDVLLSRIRQRAQETGRSVPESYVDIIQSNLRMIMAAEMGNFDDYSLWLNDSGDNPILLARKVMNPDGVWVVEIFDARATNYLSTSNLNTVQRIGETP